MKSGIAAAAIAATALTATASGASEKVGISVNGTDEGGCPIPDVSLLYELKSDVDVHARVKTGGNRACQVADSADIHVERDMGLLAFEIGYVKRGVAQESDTGIMWTGSRSQASASANLDFDLLDDFVNFEFGYDIIVEAPRAAAAVRLTDWLELDVVTRHIPSAGRFSKYSLTAEHELKDGWGIEAFYTFSDGVDNLPGDALSCVIDDAMACGSVDPQETTYTYGLGIVKEI